MKKIIAILILTLGTAYADVTTTEYYDNRRAAVVFTADDWYGCAEQHSAFMSACDAAQQYKVVISPGIVPNGSAGGNCSPRALQTWQWQQIQQQIDEGFISPVSHSLNHQMIPYGDYDAEIIESRQVITTKLVLPWQNWYNGQAYLVGWIEPYGMSDSKARSILATAGYLSDRSVQVGYNDWAGWDSGTYARIGVTSRADDLTLSQMNNNFDATYANRGVYHFYIHPTYHDWSDAGKIPRHLDHVGGRRDVWYVGWGQIYMYRYLNPDIDVAADGLEFRATVDRWQREKYGLGYPKTYAVDADNVSAVLYKNSYNDSWKALPKKTSADFFNGVDAYRIDGDKVYISKSFSATNEIYVKIKTSDACDSPFRDVDDNDWGCKAIKALYDDGIVTGAGGYFFPDRPATRREVAAMIYRSLYGPE